MNHPTDQEIAAALGVAEVPPERLVPAVLVRTGLADEYATVAGPLGPLHVAFNPHGVSAIVPTADDTEFHRIHRRTVGRPAYRASALPPRLAGTLDRALTSGRLGRLRMDLRQLTAFQREVLQVTARIPPGEVRPYGWVAREMGNPDAARAVGSALGRNPVPIAIPCHRVVRSDGSVGEYAFGAAMKTALLEHEGVAPELLRSGAMHYVGSDTTGIFCYPTCRHARRVTSRHEVDFPDVARAVAAGYRPCKVCRPAAATV
jgi:O-6-methylguanine DNA methyltransferase